MAIQLSGRKLIGLALGGLIFVRLLIALVPARLHISPETTVIDSPLRADGTPDYAAYLNDEWSAGVTPENNAAVVLVRAFGAEIIGEEVRQAYFDRLGIAVPEGPGVDQEFRDYLHANGIVDRNDWERLEPFSEAAADCQSQPWTDNDYPEVAAWLDTQQPALAAVLASSQRPRFFSPLVPPPDGNLFNALMPVVQQTRYAARLLTTQAMRELERGNVERACELTLACHRLSRLVSEHPTVIGQFVSYANVAIATAGDQAIVLSGQLTKDQAIAYRAELDALPPLRSLAAAIDRGERFQSLDMTIGMLAGRISDEDIEIPPQTVGWMFDPNPVLRQFNSLYDEISTALSLPNREQRRNALDEIDNRLSHPQRPTVWDYGLAVVVDSRIAMSKHVGHVIVGLGLPPIEQAFHAAERTQDRLLLTDIGYALAAYNAEHGTFPESLDALVLNLLPAIPVDPLTGDPLRYELKEDGFLLYSLGVNGLDDGGLIGGWHADDIAFGLTPEPDDE